MELTTIPKKVLGFQRAVVGYSSGVGSLLEEQVEQMMD
jgi:hypothetical protein